VFKINPWGFAFILLGILGLNYPPAGALILIVLGVFKLFTK